MRLIARTAALPAAMLGAAALGVGGASVVTAGPAPDPRAGGGAVGGVTRGSVAADLAGGPPWEVRSYESQTGRRCIAAARTDGTAFGPADASGRVRHADPELAASCDDAAPLVVALAEYADVAGRGARSVLFGVAGEDVATVAADDGTGGPQALALAADRTFITVRRGLSATGSWIVTATLGDGTTRTYRR